MSLQKKTSRAFGWQLIARASDRGLKLVASLVLARLLAPDDFGLLAATLVVTAAIEAISYLGIDQAIMQSSRGSDPRFLGVAFRILATRGLIIAIIVYLSAPIVAWFFDDKSLQLMVQVTALSSLFAGLCNPWVFSECKALNFKPYSLTIIAGAVAQVATSVGAALADIGAISLAMGLVVNSFITTIAGWLLIRRKLSFERDREASLELRSFAVKAAGVPFLLMISNQAPTLVLGRILGLPTLGLYTLTERLTSLPKEIALPIFGSVLTPAYASIRDDQARLRRVWLRMFGGIAQLAMPATAAMIVLDRWVPAFFYGERYSSPLGLVSILAITTLVSSLTACCGPMFWGLGRPDLDRRQISFRIAVIFLLAPFGAAYGGVQYFAVGLCAAYIAGLASSLIHAKRLTNSTWTQIGQSLLPAIFTGTLSLVSFAALIALTKPYVDSSSYLVVTVIGLSGAVMMIIGFRLKKIAKSEYI